MRVTGFTLIELLVTITLVGVIATLAVPAFAEMLDTHRRNDVAEQLASAIRTARTAAIVRNQVVVLQAIEDDWSNGWQISVNTSGKGAGDDSNIMLSERAYSAQVPIRARLRGRPFISFNPFGAPSTSNGSLFICEKNQPVSHHQVMVAVTGRVQIISGKKDQPLCQR